MKAALRNTRALLTASVGLVAVIVATDPAFAQTAAPEVDSSPGEIVVTAQKRAESVQDVGMSIQAESGDELIKRGITDTASLQKVVPGFSATPTDFGTVVFTIRGVGFQDKSLASSPTVSVYRDEGPLPFSALALGASLDLQRVEVLKGPQGTLFGNNATGGAVNYVANRPTDEFKAGLDLSYGRFADVDVQGFVSGPLSSTLRGRVAVRSNTSDGWQKGYAWQEGQRLGGKNLLNGRVSFDWEPSEAFKAYFSLDAWRDKGYNQAGQFRGIALISGSPTSPFAAAYPLAPNNARAAGWNPCINIDPFNPIIGQELGTLYYAPDGTPMSQGLGSAVQAGAQPKNCVAPRNDNWYYSPMLRLDYELADDVTVTSLTKYQEFSRKSGVDGSGMPIQLYTSYQTAKVNSFYQELRVAGSFGGKGNWQVGGNYERDRSEASFMHSYAASSAAPPPIPFAGLCGTFAAAYGYTCTAEQDPSSPTHNAEKYPAVFANGLGPTRPFSNSTIKTFAVFGNVEYPILENVTLQGGMRYTKVNHARTACGGDSGDGSWSEIARQMSNLLEVLNGTISPSTYLEGGGNGISAGPGGCATTGPGPDYLSFVSPATGKLVEDNVAWRAGVKWDITPDTMVYANVSQGYKSGGFPTGAASTPSSLRPAFQEKLIAYEAGFKSSMLDRQLTLNGAGFYYDYSNKQILGAFLDPIFGPQPALVNIPKSHVVGFEMSAVVAPRALSGLTMRGAVSYQKSRVDNCGKTTEFCINGQYHNFDQFGNFANFHGQKFPSAPEVQANLDAQYEWQLGGDTSAFIGGNVNYTGKTFSWLQNKTPPAGKAYYDLDVPSYTLVDLRAGIEKGNWRGQIWGQNVFNKYYWTAEHHSHDSILRYAGMPATYGVTIAYRY